MKKKIATTATAPTINNNNKEQGCYRNTELCINLKTLLHRDHRMKPGKSYLGILRKDAEAEEFRYDEHFTFTEIVGKNAFVHRNPHVFIGQFITITRNDYDGTLRPNFRPMPKDVSAESYAIGVYFELMKGLKGTTQGHDRMTDGVAQGQKGLVEEDN